MDPFYFKDHTADIAMVVQSRDLKGLFRNSASGLASRVFPAPERLKGCRVTKKRLSITSPSQSDLFIDWLNEILFEFYARKRLFKDAEISEINDNSVSGTVEFYSVPAQDMAVSREIKAATYHDLTIKNRGGRWEAVVILDV